MSGQSLLSLGALTLLSFLTLAANRSVSSSYSNQLQIKQMVSAISEAHNLLEEIGSTAFDQAVAKDMDADSTNKSKTIDQYKGKKTSDFTLPSKLGPETGEHRPFNDVDDYNGLHFKSWGMLSMDSLDLRVEVFYVDPLNPSNRVNNVQTAAKKVAVTIFPAGINDTLKIQQVIYF